MRKYAISETGCIILYIFIPNIDIEHPEALKTQLAQVNTIDGLPSFAHMVQTVMFLSLFTLSLN